MEHYTIIVQFKNLTIFCNNFTTMLLQYIAFTKKSSFTPLSF